MLNLNLRRCFYSNVGNLCSPFLFSNHFSTFPRIFKPFHKCCRHCRQGFVNTSNSWPNINIVGFEHLSIYPSAFAPINQLMRWSWVGRIDFFFKYSQILVLWTHQGGRIIVCCICNVRSFLADVYTKWVGIGQSASYW